MNLARVYGEGFTPHPKTARLCHHYDEGQLMKNSRNDHFEYFFQQTTECFEIAEELERSLVEIKTRSIKKPLSVRKRVQGLPYACRSRRRESSLPKLVFCNPAFVTG